MAHCKLSLNYNTQNTFMTQLSIQRTISQFYITTRPPSLDSFCHHVIYSWLRASSSQPLYFYDVVV